MGGKRGKGPMVVQQRLIFVCFVFVVVVVLCWIVLYCECVHKLANGGCLALPLLFFCWSGTKRANKGVVFD